MRFVFGPAGSYIAPPLLSPVLNKAAFKKNPPMENGENAGCKVLALVYVPELRRRGLEFSADCFYDSLLAKRQKKTEELQRRENNTPKMSACFTGTAAWWVFIKGLTNWVFTTVFLSFWTDLICGFPLICKCSVYYSNCSNGRGFLSLVLCSCFCPVTCKLFSQCASPKLFNCRSSTGKILNLLALASWCNVWRETISPVVLFVAVTPETEKHEALTLSTWKVSPKAESFYHQTRRRHPECVWRRPPQT